MGKVGKKIILKMKASIYARSALILDSIVDSSVLVHNGRTYVTLLITSDIVGYKIGFFVLTRSTSRRFHK